MVSLLAGCASQNVTQQEPVTPEPVAPAAVVEAPMPAPKPVTPVMPPAPSGKYRYAELNDPSSILAKRSVFFDFDSFSIKDEYKPLIEAHAKFLSRNGDAKMLIQGNADERGSREYNLALGQKRAEALRKALTLSGAKDAQIEAVSLGEEKPKNAGHDEAAWSENRRDDILYPGDF
jgi:peptidoglycan-associated lipoprotein